MNEQNYKGHKCYYDETKTIAAADAVDAVDAFAKPKIGVGLKHDDEKNRLDLIPPVATEGIGLVLTFGAKKYDAYNWAKGINYSRIIGAIKRHLLAIEKGEDTDSESGLLHADHIACNVAFLQTYMRYAERYKEFDDRFLYEDKK